MGRQTLGQAISEAFERFQEYQRQYPELLRMAEPELINELQRGYILIPDRDDGLSSESRYGAFLTTLVAFFLAEMGDKTQLATIALGARFQDAWLVTAGTTLGMLFADGLAVAFGEKLTERIPLKYVRMFACASFLIFGGAILLGV